MANPSSCLPTPFPLLGLPTMFIQFVLGLCGLLEPYHVPGTERYLSLRRRTETLRGQREVGREKGKEAACPQHCLHRRAYI